MPSSRATTIPKSAPLRDASTIARGIRTHFSGYVIHWCKMAVTEQEYTELQNESREMLRLIVERVTYENDNDFLVARG